MRIFLLLLVALTFISCQSNSADNNNSKQKQEIAHNIIKVEYFKYADNTYNAKDLIKSDFKPLYNKGVNRMIQVNTNHLINGNINNFITDLAQILSHRNVSIGVSLSNDFEQSHKLIVNNRSLQLFEERDSLESKKLEETALHNFFIRINELLKYSNSSEQCYLHYSEKDLYIILLTEEQKTIMNKWCEMNGVENLRLP